MKNFNCEFRCFWNQLKLSAQPGSILSRRKGSFDVEIWPVSFGLVFAERLRFVANYRSDSTGFCIVCFFTLSSNDPSTLQQTRKNALRQQISTWNFTYCSCFCCQAALIFSHNRKSWQWCIRLVPLVLFTIQIFGLAPIPGLFRFTGVRSHDSPQYFYLKK